MKIFYCWQSDTPPETGKHFIRAALDEAVEIVAADLQLEEADRPAVDQDTQGRLGSPAIVETILAKIAAADVVVSDLTPVGTTTAGKKLINSNVAYEMSQADAVHGAGVLLNVMNAHFGTVEELPFDIRHRRGPVAFRLDPAADKATREKERRRFAAELAGIFKQYIEAKRPKPAPFQRTAATIHPGAYWQADELLVERPNGILGGALRLAYDSNAPTIFLRLWPEDALAPFTGAEVSDLNRTSVAPLLSEGYSHQRNRYGMLTFFQHRREDGHILVSSTQVFNNRELWGVDAVSLAMLDEQLIIPTDYVERTLAQGLAAYLEKAEQFGYGRLAHLEAGIVNIERYRLYDPGRIPNVTEPIFQAAVTETRCFDRHDDAAIEGALLGVFEQIFDAAGRRRPPNLHGFPRPRTA